MEIEAARHNMITQQIRACDVLDDHLLEIIRTTPRELFVPSPLKNLAFADQRLPLDHGQCMLSPVEESRILQALQISESDTILEIGTGTGYMTALLAKLGKEVTTIDIFPEFTQQAQQKCKQLQLNNIHYHTQNAVGHWGQQSQFDVICVTGSLPEVPQALRAHLTLGGRLFVVEGDAPAMRATLTQRIADAHWVDTILFETTLSPLLHAVKREPFTF